MPTTIQLSHFLRLLKTLEREHIEWQTTNNCDSSQIHFYIFTFGFLPLSRTHTYWDMKAHNLMNEPEFPPFNLKCELCQCLFEFYSGHVGLRACVCVWRISYYRLVIHSAHLLPLKILDVVRYETRIQCMGLSPWHPTNNLSFEKDPSTEEAGRYRLLCMFTVYPQYGKITRKLQNCISLN